MTIFYICSVPRSIATTEPAPHTQPSCPPYPFTEQLTFAPILRDLCALRDIPFHLRFSFAPNQKRRGRPPEATKPAKGQRGVFFTRAKNSTSLQLRLTGSSRRGYGGCDESASFISVFAFHLWSQQNSAHVWADNEKVIWKTSTTRTNDSMASKKNDYTLQEDTKNHSYCWCGLNRNIKLRFLWMIW